MQCSKSNLWHVLIVLLSIVLGYWGSDKLAWKDLQPLVGVLQNTSSMVFAIAGIWIAYLYPEAIASIVNGRNSSELDGVPEDVERIRLIVGVVALSGGVMGSLVLISVAVPLLKSSSLYSTFPEIVKGVGLCMLFLLTYVQLFAVYVVLASNVNFLIRLTNIETEKRLDRKLNPLKDASVNDDNL